MRDQIFNMEWVRIGDATYCFHDSLPQTGEFGVYELGVGFSEDRVKPIYLGQGELYFRLYNHASGRSHEPIKSCLDYWLNNGYSLYCRYKISWSDEAREMEKNLKNLYLYDCNSFY
jgi:hypothetical protein